MGLGRTSRLKRKQVGFQDAPTGAVARARRDIDGPQLAAANPGQNFGFVDPMPAGDVADLDGRGLGDHLANLCIQLRVLICEVLSCERETKRHVSVKSL